LKIDGKIALVTGSAHRVGREIALNLAKYGANVAVHYHTKADAAHQTADDIRSLGREAILLQGDISSKSNWLKMREEILSKWKKIDILINNAAIFYRTPFMDISEKDWDLFQNVNLKGTFWGCQVMGEIMYQNKSGKIINIADVAAENVWPNYIPYCVSKAGVIALTKGLAKALAPYVTVNAVAPGTVLLAEKYDEEEETRLIERTPLKRIGSPQDIANTVLFLLKDTDFITGEIIKIDGGRSLT